MESFTFPPELSFDNYKLLSNLIAFSFILLSFHPPKLFLHSIVLIILITCFIVQPIIYRGKYPANIHMQVAGMAITIGVKMLIWLKNSIGCSDDDFQPFFYTLFYWRKNVTSGKKDDFQPTIAQIIMNILGWILRLFIKQLIIEGCFKLLDPYSDINEIPSTPYFFRIFEYISTFGSGTPPVTIKLLLLYSLYTVAVYFVISVNYDAFLLISGILLLFLSIILPTSSEKGKISSIKRWCILFLFDTKYIFNSPWLSTSPREFWSSRWQTFYNESWKELGYNPLRNHLVPFDPSSSKVDNDKKKRLAQLGGTLGAFCMSGLFHEYLIWTEMNNLTFEQLSFFLFHGIVLIIWESSLSKKGDDNVRRIILFLILFFTLPSMMEPYFRHEQWLMPTYLTDTNRVSRDVN